MAPKATVVPPPPIISTGTVPIVLSASSLAQIHAQAVCQGKQHNQTALTSTTPHEQFTMHPSPHGSDQVQQIQQVQTHPLFIPQNLQFQQHTQQQFTQQFSQQLATQQLIQLAQLPQIPPQNAIKPVPMLVPFQSNMPSSSSSASTSTFLQNFPMSTYLPTQPVVQQQPQQQQQPQPQFSSPRIRPGPVLEERPFKRARGSYRCSKVCSYV